MVLVVGAAVVEVDVEPGSVVDGALLEVVGRVVVVDTVVEVVDDGAEAVVVLLDEPSSRRAATTTTDTTSASAATDPRSAHRVPDLMP